MSLFTIYLYGLIGTVGFMTILWFMSIPLKNVSIVDPFWGVTFVIVYIIYGILSPETVREQFVFMLLLVWAFRLCLHLLWRGKGKGEDYRYQNFRKKYGKKNYWWISYFQVFLLQGILAWIISIPLLQLQLSTKPVNIIDFIAFIIWIVGFIFEAVGDYQLNDFKANKANGGKVLDTGLWRYTRHPNYFGDALIWWSFGIFAINTGGWWTLYSPIIMTFLLIKVSGVRLLEKDLKVSKPEYADYIRRTSAFFPLPRKKIKAK
ncbi:MAG: DUF1295 domain-containing protein [Hyphomicrobiales bacterium]